MFGRIELERAEEAGDAVVFLRCRGPGLHGDITTDSEHTRVGPDGRFAFIGSLTFPTTEHCYLYVRHPRYQTERVELADVLLQKLEPIKLKDMQRVIAAGPDDNVKRDTGNPWPQGEVYNHLSDTLLWLNALSKAEQRDMARYVPSVHEIYRQAYHLLSPENTRLRDMLRLLGIIEERTAYAYPFSEYLQAVKAGDAKKVGAFIDGGVLRETRYRGLSSTLSVAAAEGHLDVIEVLLANDEPMNIAGCGAPLLAALREKQWPAALKLIDAGADLDILCRDRRALGDTLSDFARYTRLDLLGQFLQADVPVDTINSRGTTALAEASTRGRIQSVKALLAAGADPAVRTAEGQTLLQDAINKGYLDIERELRLALAARHDTAEELADAGETISLPWRRGEPAPYRVHSSFGQVNDIVADPRTPGILWLGTAGGLLRVDPANAEQRVWGRANGLPAGGVQDLWFDTAAGYLWVATGAGLARLPLDDLDRVETVGAGEPRSSHASRFLREPPPGTVWYIGNGG
ncbi:MAG: ankyrin repeat domain-containing protein, partial [Halioglobus sp.]|nr:ankyrin repeat domain-containing protein [Halioglobus sp.]